MRASIGKRINPGGMLGEDLMWAPDDLINGHTLVIGDSGTGKTHNLRRMLRQIVQARNGSLERVLVIDPHGDIDVPASHVQFSQSSPYALNPLDLNSDPDHGGVRRAISHFLGLLQRSSTKLGPRQEAVLRSILLDVYQARGFNADNPATWRTDTSVRPPADLPPDRVYLDVPYEERIIAKDAARADGVALQFDGDYKCWWASEHSEGLRRWPVRTWGKQAPTIHDVISHTQFKLKQAFIGGDSVGLLALEDLCRAQAALIKKVKDTTKRRAVEDEEVLQGERDRAARRALSSFENLVEKIATGTELDDLIKYESSDTLKSLIDRLETLRASGVCRSVPPPFDPDERIWRFGLRAYGDEEKRFFTLNLLERVFQEALTRGECPEVRTLIVLDEAPRVMEDNPDHIITRIIMEGRKFGLALFLIAQSPTQFPDEILAGVGCKMVLGLDPMYHRLAAGKLALREEYILKIRPRQLVLVNQKPKGSVPAWHAVQLPQ